MADGGDKNASDGRGLPIYGAIGRAGEKMAEIDGFWPMMAAICVHFF
jgi:hypothetical protein